MMELGAYALVPATYQRVYNIISCRCCCCWLYCLLPTTRTTIKRLSDFVHNGSRAATRRGMLRARE